VSAHVGGDLHDSVPGAVFGWMVTIIDEQNLSVVLSAFASTLATDFPIQSILDHLVEGIITILPITSAGVTLIDDGRAPLYIASSDPSALRVESLQTELGEGPCLSACRSAEVVAITDLSTDGRFPVFARAALDAGLAAVFAFPLRSGQHRFGALNLYRDTPGPLSARATDTAQTLADVAAAYLLNAQARAGAREMADRFQRIALHDTLTGLPNRLLLNQRLEHASQRARRTHSYAAVLFIDLDKFKKVNDTHGHRVGDHLLTAVARRLSALVRPGDTLARVSGDEFVLLCEDMISPDAVEQLAQRIDTAFSLPFPIGDMDLAITASVGMAFAGPGEKISEQLVADADLAMYQAKHKGGARHQVIDLRAALQTNQLQSLERDLRAACTQGTLDVAYQPIVRTSDGLMTGVEALLRWTHPERGPVPALSVIAIAEQSDLIDEVGAWVLQRACQDRSRWLTDHPGTPLHLAVNVSPRQLTTSELPGIVAKALKDNGMDPAALVLELTESVFMDDSTHALAVITELKTLGLQLALDDFGTGYSALSYLRRLPIDIIKIDQGFVADVDQARPGGAILAAVTNLAHVLGLTVTAEGVETNTQRNEVVALGCECAQGYFYARPMSADRISEQLSAVTSRPHLP